MQQNQKAMTEQQSRKKERNRTSSRKFRDTVIAKHGLMCYFCAAILVDADRIPKSQWIEMKSWYLFWRDRFVTHRQRYLTIEHLVRIIDGGLTTIDNCVPACLECNLKRNAAMQKKRALCSWCNVNKARRGDLCRCCHKLVTTPILQMLEFSYVMRRVGEFRYKELSYKGHS